MNAPPPLADFAPLQSLPVRYAWPHEAQSFTPWLAAHLHLLARAIGLPLRLLAAKAVGEGRIADLLARDERDGSLVLIENQLEPADDAHLGRALSYAAATNPRTVVWISTLFAPPLLDAVNWLNANKGPVGFYAIGLRVLRIGDSAPAVSFSVLARPPADRPSSTRMNDDAPIAVGNFALAFWAAHAVRYPDEDALSRPVSQRCRWRGTMPPGVVIGQYVRETGASVFLRGRNGVSIEAVLAALAPVAGELERRLNVPLRADGAAVLAETTLAIDAYNPTSWPAVSDWLRNRADGYDAALRELTEKPVRKAAAGGTGRSKLALDRTGKPTSRR